MAFSKISCVYLIMNAHSSMFMDLDSLVGKILALYVDPIFMRHGVGKLLLSTAIEMVELKGGRQIEVEVEVLNNGAITFYESLLFHKVSVKLEHLFVMKKEL